MEPQGFHYPGLGVDAVDDHIIALGFVFPDENPATHARGNIFGFASDLNPEELGVSDDEDY